jgi:hypothetical protein
LRDRSKPPRLEDRIGDGRLALAGSLRADGSFRHYQGGTRDASLITLGAGVGADWLWPFGLTAGGSVDARWTHSSDTMVAYGASTLDADARVGWLIPLGPVGLWPRVGAGFTSTRWQVDADAAMGPRYFGSLDVLSVGRTDTFASFGMTVAAVDLEPPGMDARRLWSISVGFALGLLL